MAFQFNLARPPVGTRNKLLDDLTGLGLTTNLKLVLDAGDSNSVASGTQTKWLDVAGSGYDFFRGRDVSATTDDPAFNGSVGTKSMAEYWSLDGGDGFGYDGANESWMNNLHKDSAKFTIMAWVYWASGTVYICGSTNGGLENGILFTLGTSAMTFSATKTSTLVFSTNTIASADYVGWTMVAISVDEAANTYTIFRGRLGLVMSQTAACTYSSPTASAAAFTLALGAAGSSAGTLLSPSTSGTRFSSVAMWEQTALSLAQITNIYNRTRTKFLI